MMKINSLVLLVLLCLAALISSSSAPSLAGSKFRLVGGPKEIRGSKAIFTFTKDRLTWTQCNNYFCSYKQTKNRIVIGQCGGTLKACNDPIEHPLAKAVESIKEFRVNKRLYTFKNAENKRVFTLFKL